MALTLRTAIDSTDTAIPILGGSPREGGIYSIGSEYVLVRSVITDVVKEYTDAPYVIANVDRGVQGTVPATHAGAADLTVVTPGSSGPPDAHAASHESGGSDEIDVTGLTGAGGGLMRVTAPVTVTFDDPAIRTGNGAPLGFVPAANRWPLQLLLRVTEEWDVDPSWIVYDDNGIEFNVGAGGYELQSQLVGNYQMQLDSIWSEAINHGDTPWTPLNVFANTAMDAALTGEAVFRVLYVEIP